MTLGPVPGWTVALLIAAPLPVGALLGLVWHDALVLRDLRRAGEKYARRASTPRH